MAAWEKTVKTDQPDWIVVTPDRGRQSTAATSISCRMEMARCWPRAMPRRSITFDFDGQDGSQADRRLSAGTADRPEPAAGGPGRSIKGTCALTEFEVEAAAAEAPAKKRRSSSSRRRPTCESARDAARADLRRQERQEAGHRPGRIRHRRQRRHRLGNRRRPGPPQPPRKAVFVAEKADRLRRPARS